MTGVDIAILAVYISVALVTWVRMFRWADASDNGDFRLVNMVGASLTGISWPVFAVGFIGWVLFFWKPGKK